MSAWFLYSELSACIITTVCTSLYVLQLCYLFLILGLQDRVVRMRDRRGQELAGDGAEKEFPRAWGLLHETMKTKFGIDKLDFSTTTLQLAEHDDVIHRCTVKIYKPRNFQATGEGYSSRVAESRCAAMACITLRVCNMHFLV